MGLVFAVLWACSILAMAADGAVNTPQLVKDVYPGLSFGPLASAKLALLPKGVLLSSGNLKISQKDLDEEIAKAPEDLRPQLKKDLFFVLENRAVQDLLLIEA